MLQFSWNRILDIDCLISRRINSKICSIFFVDHSISLYNIYEFDYAQYKNH